MRVLELFAGSRSIGKVAQELGHEVISLDVKPFKDIDLVKSILDFDLSELPWKPDFIWASPPCTAYSIAGISHHRNGIFPKSPWAVHSDIMLEHTVDLLRSSGVLYCMENPRGFMRKMPVVQDMKRTTVCYCKYLHDSMKPTDIWCNFLESDGIIGGWEPREMCKNGNPYCHHQRAPRGSKTGTQGKTGNYQRSIIPRALCIEVLKAAQRVLSLNEFVNTDR